MILFERRSEERGFEDRGWLQSYHTFSFESYYDPEFMHFRALRVLNEDLVKGGKGFGSHMHKDMEILTYVLDGALEHKDSIGHTSVIRPGEVQYMRAGSGITHSEYNLSHQLPVHFLQIWLQPEMHNVEPGYEKRLYSSASKWGQWCLLASKNGRDGSIRIGQDCDVWATILDDGEALSMDALGDRYYWAQVVKGSFSLNGHTISKGDALAIAEVDTLKLSCLESGEMLLFDLA